MTLEDIAAKMNEALAHHELDKSVKFDFGDDGQITADGSQAKIEDGDADCTITIAKDDFESLASGALDPMMAFMSGKLKVAGDMTVAMGLQKLFGSM